MKTFRQACLAACLAGASLPAAELASAADQYTQEGAAPVAPPPAPRILPRTVWPSVELADGRTLRQARAVNADALSVTFAHAEGIGKVDRRLLPPELAAVFPFDADEAGRAARAQAAERAASAEEQNRVARERARGERIIRPRPAPAIARSPAEADPEAITAVVQARARRYFENEKRTGSGATLVFGLATELDDPEPVSGWENRWEISGIASYKVYDSLGWGSFSSRTRKFRALVEAPPGKTPKVVSFDER